MVFPDRATGDDWMRALASHYSVIRDTYPSDELAIVFDIDGTILDLRHLTVHVLLAYDRDRRTDLFHGLVAEDVTAPENQVDALLEDLGVPEENRDEVAAYYRLHLWDEAGVIAASAPYRGVLSVIRWFQIQPGTHVALNTGRPEQMRRITLDSLNAVGENARVRFEPELLFMRSHEIPVPEAKVAALDEIHASGLRIVAVIDNEPDNLAAMFESHRYDDILFLHADTMFESQRLDGPHVVGGTSYELGGLISEDRLREHVELVWHGVNDAENLFQFLGSGITWAGGDLRGDPVGRLVLRHDGFDERPWNRDERSLLARPTVEALVAAGRSIKIDVKDDDDTLRAAFDLIDELGLDDDRVWFNGEIDVVGAAGFEAFRVRYPDATASCPIDFLTPLLSVAPDIADIVLRRLRSWGVSRLSIRWANGVRHSIGELERRGWETNVYAVPDLQSFLEAAVLLPTSVTADFNFPTWQYFGRGSGQYGVVHRYELEAMRKADGAWMTPQPAPSKPRPLGVTSRSEFS
jgi:phosphoglycolate phosphatase-like HAD superfamily hydrolase